jgi:hypothetical protein
MVCGLGERAGRRALVVLLGFGLSYRRSGRRGARSRADLQVGGEGGFLRRARGGKKLCRGRGSFWWVCDVVREMFV